MTKIEEAQKKSQKMLDGARKEYSGLVQEIDAYKGKVETAADEMQKASDACDLQAYNAAKAQKDEAGVALTMYKARAKKLESEPLMDQTEYAKLCSGIEEEVDDDFDKWKEELFDLTDKIVTMAKAKEQELNEANDTLHCLQYDINRGMDLSYIGKTPSPDSIKKVGTRAQWDLIQWANMLDECALYHQMKKERD